MEPGLMQHDESGIERARTHLGAWLFTGDFEMPDDSIFPDFCCDQLNWRRIAGATANWTTSYRTRSLTCTHAESCTNTQSVYRRLF